MFGLDLQFSYKRLSCRGEFIGRTVAKPLENTSMVSRGYYLYGVYTLGRFSLLARHDFFSQSDQTTHVAQRTSLGGELLLSKGSPLRIEYQRDASGSFEAAILQIATSFGQ